MAIIYINALNLYINMAIININTKTVNPEIF